MKLFIPYLTFLPLMALVVFSLRTSLRAIFDTQCGFSRPFLSLLG